MGTRVALIWILIALSRPLSFWFQGAWSSESDVASIEEGNPINRNLALAFLVVGGFILFRRQSALSDFGAGNKLLICLYLYCAISIIWSDLPFVAFKRWFRHLGPIVLILVMLTDRRGFRAITMVFRYPAYILLPISIILIKYYPHLGRHYHAHSGEMMVTGVTLGKNALGVLCMLSALFLLVEIHQQWISGNRKSPIAKGDICLGAVAVWLLFRSHSATSLLAFYGGAITFWALGRKRMQKATSPWIFMLVLAGTILVPLGFYGIGVAGGDTTLGSFVDLTGHSETFWGRTVLWKEVIDRVPNPLLGAGYETFWIGDRMEQLWDLYWWHPNEAHNGFVGVYASIGLVGVALVVAVIAQAYRRLFRSYIHAYENEYVRIGLALLTAAILYNITEYAYLGLANMWFIILLLSIRLSSARAEASDVLEPSPAAGGWIST